MRTSRQYYHYWKKAEFQSSGDDFPQTLLAVFFKDKDNPLFFDARFQFLKDLAPRGVDYFPCRDSVMNADRFLYLLNLIKGANLLNAIAYSRDIVWNSMTVVCDCCSHCQGDMVYLKDAEGDILCQCQTCSHYYYFVPTEKAQARLEGAIPVSATDLVRIREDRVTYAPQQWGATRRVPTVT